MLPEGEDINEWVAVNTVDFFNQVIKYLLHLATSRASSGFFQAWLVSSVL
jgi:hypothetical protein